MQGVARKLLPSLEISSLDDKREQNLIILIKQARLDVALLTENTSAAWQAHVCGFSDVFPAPQWSTPPVEMQRPLGRNW